MKKLSIFIFLIIINNQLFSQDYIQYQRLFNQIDEDVLSKNYTIATQRLDSIYSRFDFIYAKHCMKALEICVTANDSLNANKWLEKCFKQGIPLWIIRNNEITKHALDFTRSKQTLIYYDSLHLIYSSSIDTTLENKLDSLLRIDQKYTHKVNDGFVLFLPYYWLRWVINNNRQLKQLKQIIETYGYPEENLIGLPQMQDSAKFCKHLTFWGASELRDSRMQIMLQHCYSTWHEVDNEFINTLLLNVHNGNMPAFQFALIIDFMYPNKPAYLNNTYFFREKHINEMAKEIINQNRQQIGLNTIDQEQRNILIERERRKNKKANSQIMLE
jgi:hypothetical protein